MWINTWEVFFRLIDRSAHDRNRCYSFSSRWLCARRDDVRRIPDSSVFVSGEGRKSRDSSAFRVKNTSLLGVSFTVLKGLASPISKAFSPFIIPPFQTHFYVLFHLIFSVFLLTLFRYKRHLFSFQDVSFQCTPSRLWFDRTDLSKG